MLVDSDIRQNEVNGLKHALGDHAVKGNHSFIYKVKDAGGDRTKLPGLAAEIIAEKPDIAVAGGGIEADALHAASASTRTPVIFMSCASSVDRGIVAGMASSENNLTGIDTNDTQLTAKRLWFIRKMLPDARKVFCFHVPSIAPSVNSLAVAKKAASKLGLEVATAEVETEADIRRATAALSKSNVDVILLLPAAPVHGAMGTIIFPKALAERIPIFGYGEDSMKKGAFATYSGSRYAIGQQTARLVHKIVNGIAPRDIPVETPEKLELVINRDLVDKLGLKLSKRVWRMADKIVDIQF
ncbi:ABC transporter substrate-binding protein [Desulfobacter hydrogenophilus]|uniref:ABC transporter substrate-binding protein n=1 Tax=Desulfobacter hydrogenophilus TaxID=2291 RepID=UPI002416CED9|nr:ABC transporter substrate-binding protein [Desulfobacter hydrogenophilus]